MADLGRLSGKDGLRALFQQDICTKSSSVFFWHGFEPGHRLLNHDNISFHGGFGEGSERIIISLVSFGLHSDENICEIFDLLWKFSYHCCIFASVFCGAMI